MMDNGWECRWDTDTSVASRLKVLCGAAESRMTVSSAKVMLQHSSPKLIAICATTTINVHFTHIYSRLAGENSQNDALSLHAAPIQGWEAGEQWRVVVAGHYHTCAIRVINGSAACWGRSDWGNLGKEGLPGKHGNVYRAPQQVDGPGVYTQLALGVHHTCGLRGDTVACWVCPELQQTISFYIAC